MTVLTVEIPAEKHKKKVSEKHEEKWDLLEKP